MKGALDDAAWSSFLIVPCGGYIESQQGPVREEDVEFLAVDCLKRLKRGLRLKEEVADKLGELAAALENEGVGFRAVGSTVYISGAES